MGPKSLHCRNKHYTSPKRGFLLSKLTAFLLSPAPSISTLLHQCIPLHNGWSPGPQGPSRKHARSWNCCQLWLLWTKVPHLKGDVRSKVVAMVNVPSTKQQRKGEPQSLLCSPCQNPHWLWKKCSTISSRSLISTRENKALRTQAAGTVLGLGETSRVGVGSPVTPKRQLSTLPRTGASQGPVT